MAAVGALLISSGIALMAAPTTASAAQLKIDHKIVICHGTSSASNPYVGISVDQHAVKGHGHTHAWGADTWWHGVYYPDGSVKPDILSVPGATAAAQLAYCNAPAEEAPQATASVTAVQPTCANGNVASYTKVGTHVATWSESAAPAPGASITVTATADPGTKFANGQSTMAFPLTYQAAETNCGAVSPPTTPQVSPPTVSDQVAGQTTTKKKAVTPTVVASGLSGSTSSTSYEAGLALTLAGLALLAGAVGVVAVEGGDRR